MVQKVLPCIQLFADGRRTRKKPQIDVNDKNAKAEAILEHWDKNESKIVYGGSQAFYRESNDEVHLPERADFKSMQDFYSTAMHEIGHSTGHETRLNRDLSGGFGSEKYAMEELRAEIASIFIEQDLGIVPSEGRLQNNAAYLQLWKKEIKDNPNALFTAIADADKIAKFVSEREKHIGKRKTSSIMQSFKKRTLIRNKFIGAIFATKTAMLNCLYSMVLRTWTH